MRIASSSFFRNSPFALACVLGIVLAGCDSDQSLVDPIMQRYEDVTRETGEIIEKKDVPTAFAYMRAVLEEEPELSSVCHGMVHEIGHDAFSKYGFEGAIAFEDDLCGSAYIHGVVETYLERVNDIEKVLPIVCPPDAAKCFHGIGHGLMYKLRNDLPQSVSLCGTFGQSFQRVQCSEGVFMETYDSETRFHASEYLKPEDPFFACRGLDKVNEGVCAFYATRYYLRIHPREYEAALQWCLNDVPDGPRDACIKGVGDTAMKQNIGDPLMVEELCLKVPENKRPYCVQGLTSYVIVHYASSKKGAEFCPRLQPANRAACEKSVREAERFYPD